ncbi:exosome complex exonuclease rrp4 [Vairimorpha apis BRL 01]|uniref:Exosome complex exonuclease rrp4 n=1 Tax=Vairimorpha apis BRL 01 TaxID=1037528 RepID=T0LBN9_9MICR|nr:exosome complex exonuclease rrp4 [Vairimorpha apis BRL 01]
MDFKLPGENICESEDYIRGHGTFIKGDFLLSSYFGTPKIINKLVTVTPKFFHRYTPEIGDVVVGRVTGIFNKKWKIEMNCKSDVSLNLSSINLPGVTQRRKLESDEILMREYFDIDDLLVAEVQKISKTGFVSLHTRSEKYKKLLNGILIKIPSSLVPQLKTKFLNFSDFEIIIGCNGYIWISPLNDSIETSRRIFKIRNYLIETTSKNYIPDFDKIL